MADDSPEWRSRKAAQIDRVKGNLAGLQSSVVSDATFILRVSSDVMEEAVIIGSPDRHVLRFRKVNAEQVPYELVIPGVDLADSQVDTIIDRWSIGASAGDIPGVHVTG